VKASVFVGTSLDGFIARSDPTPAQRLRSFLAKFEPRVAASARLALARLRKKLPGAVEIVYDNYNALAIGFGPSDRASEVIFSIAVFPRWVSLKNLGAACGQKTHGIGLEVGEDAHRSEAAAAVDH
jgi:hypothetical protein